MKNRLHKMTDWFSRRKLKQKVRSLFVVIMCAYFFMFLIVYQFVLKRNTQEYIRETNMNLLYSMSSNTESVIKNINTVSKWIMNSQAVKEYLKSDEGKSSAIAYKALDSMYDFIIDEKYLSSVYIFKMNMEHLNISNGQTVIDTEILKTEEWQRKLRTESGFYVVSTDGGGAFQAQTGRELISFMRVINDAQTQKPIGFLVMNYTADILSETYNNVTDGKKSFGYFDGTVMLSGDEELRRIYEEYQETGDDKARIYTNPIANTPFMSVVYEQQDVYSYISNESLMILMLFILITVVSLIIIGLFISNYITKPIERLVQSMDSVKQGWLKRVSIDLPNDEMGHLKDSYNNMLVEVNRLIDELVEKETAIQRAELEVLQEQIKPHFLYNTLDTIGYLALEKPGEDVYDAIETMGLFYRRFLSKGSKEIALLEEVEIVRNYLKLQALRYKNTFEDIYDIEENVTSVMVPKLILQPLVENSLYHGVRLKGEQGVIRIRAYQEDEFVYISVYDSGVGMSADQIEKTMHEGGKSFGLKRTIERIQTYYGQEDIYEIKSQVGYYCEVVIRIPIQGREEIIHVQSDDN
jgi:Predicted signal transduction protein with a C-terminal ATPase domain